jgi:two-component system, NarL family, nitrate/nitrite response regulator NarL
MDTTSPRRADARVLVADASDAVGDAVARLLRREPGVAAVVRAADAAEALRCAAELRPQLVLLDFALPETALGAYLEKLRGAAPDSRVLLLLVHPADAAAAEDAPGVAGWLLKDAGAEELRRRVRAHLDEARGDRGDAVAAGEA